MRLKSCPQAALPSIGSEREPLIRPGAANEVWSMDFVFDRIASGRILKCLAIVDDATHEAVAVIPEHTIGGDHLTRIFWMRSAPGAASRQLSVPTTVPNLPATRC
jgi:hypothetical protein